MDIGGEQSIIGQSGIAVRLDHTDIDNRSHLESTDKAKLCYKETLLVTVLAGTCIVKEFTGSFLIMFTSLVAHQAVSAVEQLTACETFIV